MDSEFAGLDTPAALEPERQSPKMSELVRSFNWGTTPLGDPAFWHADSEAETPDGCSWEFLPDGPRLRSRHEIECRSGRDEGDRS